MSYVQATKMRPAAMSDLRNIWLGELVDFAEEFPDFADNLLFYNKEEVVLQFPNGRGVHVAINGMYETYPYVVVELGWDPASAQYRYMHSRSKNTVLQVRKRDSFENLLEIIAEDPPISFDGETLMEKSGLSVRLGHRVFWRSDREVSILPNSLFEYAEKFTEF